MSSFAPINNEILICAITPYFLEQGEFWFEENFEKIKTQAKTNSWWERNTLFLRKDQIINPSEILRKLTDFGYEKVREAASPGEYSQRGGIIEIFPVNSRGSLILEFSGNRLEEIFLRPALIAENEKLKKKFKKETDFQEGDFLVHLDHGIGIFRGFQEEPIDSAQGKKNERYFILEYAPPARPIRNNQTESNAPPEWISNGARPSTNSGQTPPPDRLLVPENQLKKLSLYIGFETPKIHRLGGSFWFKTKKRIKEEAEKLAKELLELYALRKTAGRPPYEKESAPEKELALTFSHIETPDQKRAIGEVKNDMEKSTPMDRIVCGDVGFGKTEVALRAAAKAALSGRQTAILAPTTILCEQHFETFQERLKNFPVNIAMLSRLTSPKEERKVLDDLKTGRCDIV
ncbi:MAG: CarD family transcriptional regulator, partial [bacterium]|nr:CarD family transcriptional regulator [bacterium]